MKCRVWVSAKQAFASTVDVHHDGSWGYTYDEWSERFQQFVEIGCLPEKGDVLEFSPGIQTKTGETVYAGDIVKRHNGEIGTVVFRDCCFCLDRNYECNPDTEYIEWPTQYFEGCEVVGNVHQHPELLK